MPCDTALFQWLEIPEALKTLSKISEMKVVMVLLLNTATVWDICNSVYRAIELYEQRERVDEIRKFIMQIDNSWEKSAEIYINLYNTMIKLKVEG